MPRLDSTDIQGFVLRGYTYPVARFLFVELSGGQTSLDLVDRLTPHITTGERWDKTGKPKSTLNIGFTYAGLCQLSLQQPSLQSFPDEFVEGMRARSAILNDTGCNAPEHWDKLWLNGSVHVWLAIYGDSPASLESRCAHVLALIEETKGGRVVGQQDAAALHIGDTFNKEHFGYSDGFGNPDYVGVDRDTQPGQGKLNQDGVTWSKLATGELLLGHADEADELPVAPEPHLLGDNGTFMVYRKLHQNVQKFRDYIASHAPGYPDAEKLKAKFVGRWLDGTPLELSADHPSPEIVADKEKVVNFTYSEDSTGAKCPFSAHIRRANPRDAFGFQTKLINRRRISRRGLPYGSYVPPDQKADDTEERGIVFMALNASLFRQFEFVQQQWIEYGNDSHQGNDKDALLGNHEGTGRFMIQGEDTDSNPPFMCGGLPSFVELRGGDYFFLPSITALRLIASGQVDPR